MKMLSNMRKTAGATLGLVAACVIFFSLIAAAFFYIIETFSGDKQVINATDAGALAAAQQILAVTLTKDQVSKIPNVPQEFLSLGVNPDGSVDSDSSTAIFDIRAYNNCAAYTVSIALSAAADPTPAAITNAQNVISALNQFAADLNQNMQNPSYPKYPGNAASTLMAANPAGNLAKPKLFSSSQISLVPGSLHFGYYTLATNSASNVYLSPAIAKTLNQAWLAQCLSTTKSPDGSSYLLAGNKLIDFSAITGVQGLGRIALDSLESEPTHLIAGENFSTTIANMSQSASQNILPCSAVQLGGIAGASPTSSVSGSGSNGNNSNGPKAGNSSDNLNLIAISAAVIGSPAQTFNLPGKKNNTGGCAYVAIINGGDFQTSLNQAGLSAAFLQAKSCSNVNFTSTTNIAYNGSKTDIFDILEWASRMEGWGRSGDWIFIGSSVPTGLWSIYQNQGINAFNTQAACQPQNFPPSNYNDVIDDPNLALPTASIPFVFLADYYPDAWDGAYLGGETLQTTVNASEQQCLADFGPWIAYNLSTGTASGTDGLGRNPALDPLKGLGGSPALFAKNPNFVVPNTLISATSDFMQTMTLADALKLVDICVVHDGYYVFNGQQPAWIDNLMDVIASNYGLNYLPTPVSPAETRPNGVTGIEYAKFQVIAIHAGLGLSENPPVLPSNPGFIYLPWSLTGTQFPNFPGSSKVSSGQRYFVAYDTNGKRTHLPWPGVSGDQQFETPGTPGLLLRNMNILNNAGTFNPADQNYNKVLNAILATVQKMNPAINMTDLNTVLNGPTGDTAQTGLDLGQTFYLICNSSQKQNHGLEMLSALPAGTTFQPPDGGQPSATYTTNYPISNNIYDSTAESNSTLVDTSAAPNSQIVLPNGQTINPAPYGDSEMHKAPYNVIDSFIPISAQDTAIFVPSSGGNNDNGAVYFSKRLAPVSDWNALTSMKRNLLVFAAVAVSNLVTIYMQAEAQNPQQQEFRQRMLQQKQSNNQGKPIMQPGFVRHGAKNFVPQRQEFRQKMLQRFDANHDGKIDESERAQMRQARHQHRTFEQPEQPNNGPGGSQSAPPKSQ